MRQEIERIFAGDLVKCKKTGSVLLVTKAQTRSYEDGFSLSVIPMPGSEATKWAWWGPDEYEVFVKGPAHDHWDFELERHLEEIERNYNDIEWVISNWNRLKDNLDSRIIATVVNHIGIQTKTLSGLALNGESGIMALCYLEMWNRNGHKINALIESGKFFDHFPLK